MSTDGDSTLSNTIDKLVPVTSDGTPIIWTDDNDAHIEGLLHEVGKFYKRTGRFQSFFKQRATVLSNGKLAVDSLDCVSFIANKIKDGYSFENPCPPTAERVTAYDVARRTTGTPVHGNKTLPTLTEIPDELKDTTVLSEHAVELEDSKLLTSLTHVFGHSISSDELIDEADGSGYKLLTALRKRAANANTKDKALVAAQYARVIRDGVPSGTELTFKTLKDYIKEYKAIKRNVPPTSRQSDAAEVDMIDLIAVKDPSVREIYDIKRTATPPTNLDSAVGLLSSILRGRARCEEIDEVNSATASPAKSLGLFANRFAPNQDKAEGAPAAPLHHQHVRRAPLCPHVHAPGRGRPRQDQGRRGQGQEAAGERPARRRRQAHGVGRRHGPLPLRRRGRQAPLQGLPQVQGEGRQEGQEGCARRGAAHSRPPPIRRHGRHLGAP